MATFLTQNGIQEINHLVYSKIVICWLADECVRQQNYISDSYKREIIISSLQPYHNSISKLQCNTRVMSSSLVSQISRCTGLMNDCKCIVLEGNKLSIITSIRQANSILQTYILGVLYNLVKKWNITSIL